MKGMPRPTPLCTPPAGHGNRGATLIEVLIAILVLAVGILGLMGLQINGKRTTYEALQRSMAVGLAQDMMNRLRANPNTVTNKSFLADSYGTASYTGGGVGGGQVSAPGKDCAADGAGCTRTELAAFDLAAWEAQLDDATRTGLVNPTGCVHIDTDPGIVNGSSVTVMVAWESRVDLDQTQLVARMPAALECGAGKYGTDDLRRQAVVISTFLANR